MAPDQGRRSALAKLVFGGLGVIVAGLGSLLGLAATPRMTPRAKRWRRAASMFDLPPDKPMLVVLTDRRADGWYEARAEMPIFIDRDGPNGYRAVSPICTHLGCRVDWSADKKQFVCPCHGGVYDRDGSVVSGPPPRPLDRLQARVNQDTGDIEVEA